MKKAVIIYQSRTGITRRFGEEFGRYLKSKGLDVKVISIQEYNPDMAEDADVLLLGCWTAGWMIMLQSPDRHWIRFVKQLPDLRNKKVALFTTYKLLTGRMFRMMHQHLEGKVDDAVPELKSRNGRMNDEHRQLIDSLIIH
ncbi:MAG: flavodoxin domain-containing protein [Bacteroidales bacterium]|nr:flavodoxin domain-containing protein [Bacteroidales bacterium]